MLAGRRRYHPIAEWIDQHMWDGKDRLLEICGKLRVAELTEHRVKVDYVQVWRFVDAQGLSPKKRDVLRTTAAVDRGDTHSGRNQGSA